MFKKGILKVLKSIIISLAMLLPVVTYAHDSNKPPELWSLFKDLNKSSAACKIQSSFILEKIGVRNLVENNYGLYGEFKNNRVVVKCVDKGEKSTLWVAIAGNDRDSVELIRNKIIKDIQ